MERRFSKKKGMGKKRKPSMLRKLLRENNNSYYPVTPQITREVCPPTSTITAPRVTSVRGELSSLTTPIKGEVCTLTLTTLTKENPMKRKLSIYTTFCAHGNSN
eukprot:XP_011417943.1 PREDICTED: uncharacterized protein LOC105321373 [Crassostrea gigas]